jgi:hypothetical protein
VPLVSHLCAHLAASEPLTDRRPFWTNRRTPASSAQIPSRAIPSHAGPHAGVAAADY